MRHLGCERLESIHTRCNRQFRSGWFQNRIKNNFLKKGEIFRASWVWCTTGGSLPSYSYSVPTLFPLCAHSSTPLLLCSPPSYSVGSRASQGRHVRVKQVIEKMVVTKLFFLHLLLGFLSAQWWGLPPGFRPRTRLGAQRVLRIPNQAAGSYYGAPTGRNFFQVSESLLIKLWGTFYQTYLNSCAWVLNRAPRSPITGQAAH